MTDIPVTLTYDNVADIALEELIRPLELTLKGLEDQLTKANNESEAAESANQKALSIEIEYKNPKLFRSLKSLGPIEWEQWGPDNYMEITMIPRSKHGKGELSFNLGISKKEYNALPSKKALDKTNLKYDKLCEQERKLRKEIYDLKGAKLKSKQQLIKQFITSNAGHNEFKKLVKQKIMDVACLTK